MDMSVGLLDHYNVSTRKLNETVQFYEDVLGFTNGPRPPFNFPGAWLYSGEPSGAAPQRHLAAPTGSSAPIPASSIMSRSAAAVSRRPSSTSPARASPTA